MRGLPIVNPELLVEAVGVRRLGDHKIFVLITPWFMNLVLLPGTDVWKRLEQGTSSEIDMPGETLQFTVCHDDVVGTFLTAALFGTVTDFPNQNTARCVAAEILQRLFSATGSAREQQSTVRKKRISRRELLTGAGAD